MSQTIATTHPILLTSRASDGTPNGVGDYSAEELRRLFQALRGKVGGLLQVGDFLITPLATPGSQINVATGRGWVVGTESSNQGIYLVILDAAGLIDVPAADVSQPRRDLVVCEVLDLEYGVASTRIGRIRYVANSVLGGSAAFPSLPNNAFEVGKVVVPAGVTTVVGGGAITNTATLAALSQNTIQFGQLPGILAEVKAAQTDATANTAGDLVISTRRLAADAALTEALRVKATGHISAAQTPTGAAGVGAYGMRLLFEQYVTSGTVTDFTFSSIPSGFRTLELEWCAITDQVAGQQLLVRMNGDAGANYSWSASQIAVGASNNTNGNTSGGGVTSARIGSAGTVYAAGTCRIHNYALLTVGTYRMFEGTWWQDSDASGATGVCGGEWKEAATAENSLKVFPAAGLIKAGSWLRVWGRP